MTSRRGATMPLVSALSIEACDSVFLPTRDKPAALPRGSVYDEALSAPLLVERAKGAREDGMESHWLTYAKRLQAIASTGLYFCRDQYDRERLEEVAEIANAMLADLGNVPLERITDLVPDFAKGYVTPRVDVRGALIEEGQVLLVRERCDGRWTLPGGFADVGRSAAENVEKEMLEEAGLAVKANALYSVRHKAKQAYEPDSRDFYKLFFLCDRSNRQSPRAGGETSDARFFPPDQLPDLSMGRVTEADIGAAFAAHRGDVLMTAFD